MRECVYALRFRGQAEANGPDGNVLTTITTAPSCTFTSRIGTSGLSGGVHPVHVHPADGEEASLESELVFTGATTFQATGAISFGPGGHRLRVSTIGHAYLGPAADDERRHGAAIWQIDGGDGQFAGATGLIVSTLVVDAAGEVTDHQLGVVYVR